MLTYSFENIDSESMYEHLYRCIKQDILQEKLRAGEKLPSKRAFAKNLGVSTITVRERLRPAGGRGLPVCPAQAGLLRLRPGAEGDGPAAAAPQAPDARHPAGPQADLLGGLCRQLGGQGYVSLLRVGQAPAGRDRRGGRGDPSGRTPPPGASSSCARPFRTICISSGASSVDPEQIVVGAGTEYLYSVLVQLLGRHRGYAVEDPGYSKAALGVSP